MLLASVPRLGVRWEDLPIPEVVEHDGDASLDEVEDDHFVAHVDHMSTVDG
jgi:hypothetical protein